MNFDYKDLPISSVRDTLEIASSSQPSGNKKKNQCNKITNQIKGNK